MDYTVHGILQARILEWVYSRGSSQPRDGNQVSHTTGGFLTNQATGEALGSLPLWKVTTEPITAKFNSLFLILIWLEL